MVAELVRAHPNIGAGQSYHNAGGMILRGPGNPDAELYHPDDAARFDHIAEIGKAQLPHYRYLVVGKDMYTVYGGELDWFYGARGIFMFTNELWSSFDYFREQGRGSGWFGRQEDVYKFDELLLFGEGIIDWKPVVHPQYGDIEIGGIRKNWTRTAPSFLIEDMCHRNMAFTLFHAYHLPEIAVDSVQVQPIGQSLLQIDVVIRNDRMLPTRSAREVQHQFTRPDWVTLNGADVVAGFVVTDPLHDRAVEQKYHPQRMHVQTVPGMGTVQVRWLVRSAQNVTVSFDSHRGGHIERAIELR
ncbi:MAG: hypothetical protein U5R06_00490 [candidate division KSB1 bacterium]|nr:hypothetical protein [candidate division KSB1 bacterium]